MKILDRIREGMDIYEKCGIVPNALWLGKEEIKELKRELRELSQFSKFVKSNTGEIYKGRCFVFGMEVFRADYPSYFSLALM